MDKRDRQITTNFRLSEFACKCGCGFGYGPADLDRRLVIALQTLRTVAGVPIIINSGCRCPAHNKAIGGAPQSLHLEGKAADIRSSLSVPRLKQIAEAIPMFRDGGIGTYDTWLHVDVRGFRARW